MNLKLWPILAILVLSGCDSSRLYEENHDFENMVWTASDIRSFSFEITDSETGYNIYFNIRNTLNYPHYNLYISYQLKDSLNQSIKEGLENVNLFDPKSGDPYGQSSIGNIFDHQFLLLEDYKFDYPGMKSLSLQQYMRYDSLPEIVSTGIRVEFYSPDGD